MRMIVYCLVAGMMKKWLRLPATSVPTAKNTYMCLGINLPADVAVSGQLPIAVEPHLDNTVVMHHMNFWGCRDVPSKLRASITTLDCDQS